MADHKLTLHATDATAAAAPAPADAGPLPEVVMPPASLASPPDPTVTATARPSGPPAAALAEQVAPALLTLGKSADGSRETTVQLQPAELGLVQIRLIRAASGVTRVDITAEKPATLLALQRDQPQLHLVLDQAGIPAAGRSVTFHSVPPPPAGPATGSGQSGGQPAAPGGNGGGGAQSHTNTDAGGSKGHQLPREQNSYSSSRRTGSSASSVAANVAAAAQTYRIGLDITA